MGRKTFSWMIALALVVALAAAMLPARFAAADDEGGNPVSLDTAKQVAVNQLNKLHLGKIMQKGLPSAEEPEEFKFDTASVSEVFTETKEGKNVYYVINLHPEGWAIVSADYVAHPIIAYSDTGSYSEENHPPAFNAWMENVKEYIYQAIAEEVTPLEEATEAWQALDAPTGGFFAKESAASGPYALAASSVSTLLTTTWGQGGSYQLGIDPCCWPLLWYPSEDFYCPAEINWAGYYQVAPTGCVATAMEQIMNYHEWPPTGKGSHTWKPPYQPYVNYGLATVDFSARTYDWAIMPDDVPTRASGSQTAGELEVAKLLRDIGVAQEMHYNPAPPGSASCFYQWNSAHTICDIVACDASYSSSLRHGAFKTFRKYFRYHATYTYRDTCYTDSDWINRLKGELDANRPVLYAGVSGSGGHAFVCDGYDADDNFHFNFGWDGGFNGYYNVDALKIYIWILGVPVLIADYSSGQSIVFNIRPDRPPVAVCKPATLYLDGNGEAVLSPSAIDGGSYDREGSSVTLSIDRGPFDCTDIGTEHTVTLYVQDSTGNTATCEATVIVEDAIPPTIYCPADVTIECDESSDPSSTGQATAVDNCDPSITVLFTEEANLTGCSGTITRTWTATDDCGNSSSCSQVITVIAPAQPDLWAVEYRWGDPPPGYSFANWPIFEGWMDVRIENRGAGDAFNVTAEVMSWPLNTTVPDPNVTVGDIPAGSSAWSTDTFTTRVDMANPGDPCDQVFWRIEYDDAAGAHHVIENVPEFPPGEEPGGCGGNG